LYGWVGVWVCLPFLFPLGVVRLRTGAHNLSRVLRGAPVDVVAGLVPLLVHP
jgi:hypothetical protein